MFAVPGWSVAADGLKAEAATDNQPSAPNAAAKKRKRGNAQQHENVDSSSVGDLWTSVVEGKGTSGGKSSQKRQRTSEVSSGDKADSRTSKQATDSPANSQQKKSKEQKKQDKKAAKVKKDDGSAKSAESTPVEKTNDTVAAVPPPVLPAAPKLTPLQASMRQKLISARFRHLNETLYTRPSEEAFSLFQESPEMFEEYHEGFRQQVKVWPENPVGSFLKDIRARGKAKAPGKGKPPAAQLSKTPLPRTTGTCTIADLGCGDAQLSQSLDADKSKLRLQLKSYDLQAPNEFITKADIANLPLEDDSVNVAIFCLALMGTNWVDFIEEAYRILHWKGELWVAEIKSRFGPVKGKKAPVRHSVGARSKKAAGKKDKGNSEGLGENEDDLAVEVDGADDKRRETDVSAFVEVLKKRGFVLQGERNEAIDLSNRMFVKMHFIKGAPPTKGKGVTLSAAGKTGKGGRGGKGEKMLTFEEHAKNGDDDAEVDEAAILKPCVYKIR